MAAQILPRARLALADAGEATERLKATMATQGNYRIDWAATMALLRAVGHVLEKVDARGSPEIESLVAEAWREWNDPSRSEHAIFREFIEAERNAVLKQYEFGRHAPSTSHLLTEDGGLILLGDGSGSLLTEEPDIDRIDAALAWWEKQLTAIESSLT